MDGWLVGYVEEDSLWMVSCKFLVHKMYVWSGFSKVSIKYSLMDVWLDGWMVGRLVM